MRLDCGYTVTPSLLLHLDTGYIKYRNPDVAIDNCNNYRWQWQPASR